MADDTTFQSTAPATPPAGFVAATDEVSSRHYQRMKVTSGEADSEVHVHAGNGTAVNSLRVTIASDSTGQITLAAGANAIGSVTVSNTVTVTGPLTDTQLRASPISVTGTVTATGPLTDTELRATPVPISGTVTANAGTNLNTSALALEAGGNLAAAAASLSVVDDWDESDRAKTNPIVGQAGVQGGSGAVSANTLRVSQATDVNVNTVEVVGATVFAGQNAVATAGTQEALASTQAVKSVTVKAHVTNTGNIFVGDSNVDSTTGYILGPGEAISLDIANLATVYIDSAVSGEGVSYVAVGT